MKIRRLKIHNIASIEDAEIDFSASPLVDTDVFLICGNVGAGKSTILDSVCLALFGGTPRLSPRKKGEESDTVRIMRRGTSRSSVELEFTANDGSPCVASWERRTAKKSPEGKVRAALRLLTVNPGTPEETTYRNKEVDPVLTGLIGLDFADFCRTTVLAQGQFASFLKGTDDDKAVILEKLTGTQHYTRLGIAIYNAAVDARQALENEKGKLTVLSCLSDEEADAIRASLAEEKAKSAAAQERFRKADSMYRYVCTGIELETARRTAGTRLAEAERAYNSDKAAERRKFLTDWEGAEAPRADAAALTLRRKEITAIDRELAGMTSQLGRLRSAYALICKDDFLDDCINREKAVEKALGAAEEKEKSAREALESAEKELTLSRALKICSEERMLGEMRAEAGRNAAALGRKRAELPGLKAREEKAVHAYNTVELSFSEAIAKLRSKLKVGDVCPVCLRGIEEAIPAVDSVFSATLAGQKRLAEEATAAVKACNDEIVRLETILAQSEKAVPQLEARLQSHKERYPEVAELAATLEPEDAEAVDARHSKALKVREDAAKAHDSARNATNSARVYLADVRGKLESERTTLRNRRAALGPAMEAMRESRPEWFSEPAAPAKSFDEKLLAEASQFMGRHSSLESRLSAARAEAARLGLSLDSFRKEHGYGEAYFARLCSADRSEIQGQRAEEKALADGLTAARASAEDSERALRAHAEKCPPELPEGAAPEELKALADVADSELASAREAVGKLQAQLDADARNASRRKAIMEQVEVLEKRAGMYRRLSDLFGSADGKKFRTIAQSYVLANLIHSANFYMKSLMDRYRLEGEPNSYAIYVVDSYDGNARRSAQHISGGETFVVSLALALALADISSGLAVDTLFIDEGFGNLSGQALEDAVNTLDALRRHGGRRVGIISHIESLRDRFPVQICVDQMPGRNSSAVSVLIRQ